MSQSHEYWRTYLLDENKTCWLTKKFPPKREPFIDVRVFQWLPHLASLKTLDTPMIYRMYKTVQHHQCTTSVWLITASLTDGDWTFYSSYVTAQLIQKILIVLIKYEINEFTKMQLCFYAFLKAIVFGKINRPTNDYFTNFLSLIVISPVNFYVINDTCKKQYFNKKIPYEIKQTFYIQ